MPCDDLQVAVAYRVDGCPPRSESASVSSVGTGQLHADAVSGFTFREYGWGSWRCDLPNVATRDQVDLRRKAKVATRRAPRGFFALAGAEHALRVLLAPVVHV
jgi:hypothetical protein